MGFAHCDIGIGRLRTRVADGREVEPGESWRRFGDSFACDQSVGNSCRQRWALMRRRTRLLTDRLLDEGIKAGNAKVLARDRWGNNPLHFLAETKRREHYGEQKRRCQFKGFCMEHRIHQGGKLTLQLYAALDSP